MLTDIEIAEGCKLRDIREIAKKLNIGEDNLELYGKYKAKINLDKVNPKSKLILVTAINPTASGEGKTTVSIGLADGMAKLGKKVCLALREPSLGPVFGIKGGLPTSFASAAKPNKFTISGTQARIIPEQIPLRMYESRNILFI